MKKEIRFQGWHLFTWNRIDDSVIGEVTHAAAVPGGWLVKVNQAGATSVTYIPDPDAQFRRSNVDEVG